MNIPSMTLAEARALREGDVIRVHAECLGGVDFDHGGEQERTAPAGSLAQVNDVRDLGRQGWAVTFSIIAGPGYGITNVFDQGDPEPCYPFSRVTAAELADIIRKASDYVAEYNCALDDEDQEGGPQPPDGDAYNDLSDAMTGVLNGGAPPRIDR